MCYVIHADRQKQPLPLPFLRHAFVLHDECCFHGMHVPVAVVPPACGAFATSNIPVLYMTCLCIRWWRQLPPTWRSLMCRDEHGMPNSTGPVWGCPYRWGATLLAYKRDALKRRGARPITDWSDLLQPQLRGMVAFPESAREFLGIVFKTLGLSYNTTVKDLEAAGISREQVKVSVVADLTAVGVLIGVLRGIRSGCITTSASMECVQNFAAHCLLLA